MMMTIDANTKIARILKEDQRALDAIISISPRFEKLRNPLLRRVMAPRTTLGAASKMGGCTMEDFYAKLEPLGFKINRDAVAEEEEKKAAPAFVTSLKKEQLVELDVRPVISSGSDPLNTIMSKVKALQPGQVLKIINTFEPTPLISMLQKKGFESWVNSVDHDLIETFFYKSAETQEAVAAEAPKTSDWDQVVKNFGENVETIDVRHLEAPQPMLTILDALDHLAADKALFVHHKRIPVFLLPELAQRGFEYRVKEIKDGEVHLFIFRNQ